MSRSTKAKMQRKNAATQTEAIDTVIEVARLQEQVKLLTIENEHLRKYTVKESSDFLKPTTPETSPNIVNETPKHLQLEQKALEVPSTQKRTNKKLGRGCTCKGNCSTKMCGCMKKDMNCEEYCKCNVDACQNQVHESLMFDNPKQLNFASDKEQEEEEDKIKIKSKNKKFVKHSKNDQEDIKRKRGRPRKNSVTSSSTEQLQKSKGSTSEEEEKQIDQKTKTHNGRNIKMNENIVEIQKRTNNIMENIANGMVSLRRGKKGLKTTSAKKVISDSDSKEETSPTQAENNTKMVLKEEAVREQIDPQEIKTIKQNTSFIVNETVHDEFDPMKPKHELTRTPIHGSISRDTSDESLSSRDTSGGSLSMSVTTRTEEPVIPEEFNQPQVNWEEYQSQLVACNKCYRRFHPLRIEKHESCCKKL